MSKTSIEWTEQTWNPVRGCDVISPGCKNCYAMRTAHRFGGASQPYEGLTVLRSGKPTWTGRARFVPEMLTVPLRRRKPTTFFVNSMSDLFHEDITNEQIAAVFGVMVLAPQHTFQVLTKRAERLPKWFDWYERQCDRGPYAQLALPQVGIHYAQRLGAPPAGSNRLFAHTKLSQLDHVDWSAWPLPNVHLGVSVEDQQRADERIPHLLSVPAAVRWISAEPLLGPVDLNAYLATPEPVTLHTFSPEAVRVYGEGPKPAALTVGPGLDWIVVGGESGPGARRCARDWLQSIVRQCKAADVPVFVKQLGARYEDPENGIGGHASRAPEDAMRITNLRDPKGGDVSEFPAALRVREMPR